MISLAILACAVLAETTAVVVLLRTSRRLVRQVERNRLRRRVHLRLRISASATTRGARARYLEHFQDSPVAVLFTTPDGQIVAANRAVVDLLGYRDEDDLRRCNATDLYANPLDRARTTRASLDVHRRMHNVELKLRRRDGAVLNVLATVRTVSFPESEQLYESVCTDITELRRATEEKLALESQLYLSQKLEAVGQLAAGIAHEINTPIQFIGDNTYFLRDSFQKLSGALEAYRDITKAFWVLSADDVAARLKALSARLNLERLLVDVQQAFEESFEGITRVTEIVRAMKEFAHPGDGELAATDLNQAIQTTLVVARNEYKHIADVATDFGDLPAVMCRRGEINKVLLNMIVNATHAIEQKNAERGGRGTLTIKTRADDTYAIISIADDGCGIPASVISRIFDPFFTTKPVGKGTGQGLAIARAVVNGHGGRIDVQSVTGQGTTFTIRIPLGDQAHAEGAPGDISQAEYERASGGEGA